MMLKAYRNIRLCTKDCLCLYVCPTGASDTENSIIDTAKCIGCEVCAKACPSGAISMVPEVLPAQQKKDIQVVAVANQLSRSKVIQEKIAKQLAENTDREGYYCLMKAFEKSNRLVAEDLLRESGYMLPQSKNAHDFLEALLVEPMEGLPIDTIKELLALIPCNEIE